VARGEPGPRAQLGRTGETPDVVDLGHEHPRRAPVPPRAQPGRPHNRATSSDGRGFSPVCGTALSPGAERPALSPRIPGHGQLAPADL
jgi:hypothetical protein